MKQPKYLFGDIVVIDEDQIGVIVKSWIGGGVNNWPPGITYDIYVRSYNSIKSYKEEDVERYRVRHKYLDEQEIEWQNS